MVDCHSHINSQSQVRDPNKGKILRPGFCHAALAMPRNIFWQSGSYHDNISLGTRKKYVDREKDALML